MTETKTLYTRGVDSELIQYVKVNHMINGYETRGEFLNEIIKEGIKVLKSKKASKKKTAKKKVTRKKK